MRKWTGILVLLLGIQLSASAQNVEQTFYKLRDKILSVKDYSVDVRMKINVYFMRIPDLKGKIYFKAPDKLRLERNGGISILPRRSTNITLNNLVPSGNASIIDAGYATLNDKKLHIIKVVPSDDNSPIVLTKIWVDETNLLAMRLETTTKDEGTIQMEMQYGQYANYALPDKTTIHIDVKEYKLPKGVVMDYDGVDTKQPAKATGRQKGKVEINYKNYHINQGVSDEVFKDK